MKSVLLATVLLVVGWLPAAAGQQDVDTTTAIVQAAIDARGTDDYEAALVELYDFTTDETAKPECRRYADTMLAGLVVMDIGERYPESSTLLTLFGWIIEYAPTARNDCLLAI